MQMAKEYRQYLFSKKTNKFIQPLDGLVAFEQDLRQKGTTWSPIWNRYADYVAEIIRHYSDILILKPSEFENYQNLYFNGLTADEIKSKDWQTPKSKVSFYEKLVNIMHYKDVRSSEMISYIKKLDIKTCIYCNSQYTATIHISSTEVKGGYQLDHFYPKSRYPFLCISFFNLQPTCGCCNNWKNEQPGLFNLYTDDPINDKINPFKFSLSAASIVRYMLSQDAHDLSINFESSDLALLTNHEKLFHVSRLYENFKDEAEELLWKQKTNNKVFIQQLQKSFTKLFPNHVHNFHRFLYGLYELEKDIHRKPLTKMQQDIARQLGIIK